MKRSMATNVATTESLQQGQDVGTEVGSVRNSNIPLRLRPGNVLGVKQGAKNYYPNEECAGEQLANT
jgi:hypothetical protein